MKNIYSLDSRVEGVDAPLLEVHLRVDVGELPLEPLDPRLGVVHVGLQEVGVILRARSRTRGVY